MRVKSLLYIALFSAVTAVCSWISVPFAVPFTLQSFAVLAAAGLLKPKQSVISVGVYILLGAAGVPVFSGFKGGIGVLAGPTGGYIMGFVLTALAAGLIIKRFGGKTPVLIFAFAVGMILCYALGTAWYCIITQTGVLSALSVCVLPFLLPDAAKAALAVIVVKKLERVIKAD